jgi:hypothetical protein
MEDGSPSFAQSGGVILPLLGFWLVPIGLLFIALDIGPLRRRVEVWFESSS